MGNIIKIIQMLLFVAVVSSSILVVIAASYGKFDLVVHGVEECSGPRHKDCATFKCSILPGGNAMLVSFEVLEDTPLDVFRILGYNTGYKFGYKMDTKNKSPMVDVKLEMPCDQPFLLAQWNMSWVSDGKSGKTCLIKKSTYNFTVDAMKFAHKLWLDDNFFYGDFTFKSTLYGRRCNIGCNIINVTFSPKKQQ